MADSWNTSNGYINCTINIYSMLMRSIGLSP